MNNNTSINENKSDQILSEGVHIYLFNKTVPELKKLLKAVLIELKKKKIELKKTTPDALIRQELINALIEQITKHPYLMKKLGIDLSLINREVTILELLIDPDSSSKAKISRQGDHFGLEEIFSVSSPEITSKSMSQFIKSDSFDQSLHSIKKATGLKKDELIYKYKSLTMVHFLIALAACQYRGTHLYIIFLGTFFKFLEGGKLLDRANEKIISKNYLYKTLLGQVKKHRRLKKELGTVNVYPICQTNFALFFPERNEFLISSTKDFNSVIVKYHTKKYDIVSLVFHDRATDNNSRHQFHMAVTRRLLEHTSCTRNWYKSEKLSRALIFDTFDSIISKSGFGAYQVKPNN